MPQSRDDPRRAIDHQKRKERLCISQNTSVLGVNIKASPQAEYALMHDVPHRSGIDPEPELHTWTGERYDRGCRAEIAAWARRTLFSIEGSHAE